MDVLDDQRKQSEHSSADDELFSWKSSGQQILRLRHRSECGTYIPTFPVTVQSVFPVVPLF